MNRRRFVHVLAASGAALLAGRLPQARAAEKGATTASHAERSRRPPAPALERELRRQEKSLADTLRVVRAYDLPPGAEPATLFRPMRARRRDR